MKRNILEYQYRLNTLKSCVWIFGILLIINWYNLCANLILRHNFLWEKALLVIIFTIVFINTLHQIKTKNYKIT
ncbi:hypothetical protein COL87_25755 [Bacillus pseudomycoides]|uniref:Uncharacterized protein n=1 Tax=Bacillus pseudomycoides TaxID=64104 RepID=A0ABD6SYR5_9BACI|nr:putative membrane protein [Bacillus pseudomycoides]AJI19954.1 putative membrane protein [Bacillus pseudomycoides]KFN11661.1 putative membrane protein [Bacillus pseudomycoides]MBD5797961.1 hypothetical protein [Bacillus pseudomycoides]MDR4189010.1 hypothetical protein [Bacillus pseudomycoides]